MWIHFDPSLLSKGVITDPCIFIAEAATLQRFGLDVVKNCLPNSYITILGSDSINYGLDPRNNSEVPGILEYVDLWLDLHDDIVDSYRTAGVVSAKWHWTTSEWYINQIDILSKDAGHPRKDVDYIGLFRVSNHYRDLLWSGLSKRGLRTIKSGAGVTYEAASLYEHYSRSKFCLGTTSPSWTNCRTIKGFRDWIAPLCGTILCYDNHPSILKNYSGLIHHIYNYDDPWDTLATWAMDWRHSYTMGILERQQAWVRENTIARQLEKWLVIR